MGSKCRRIVSLILIIVMLVSVFLGCEKENVKEKETAEIGYRLADLTKEEITLKYWFWHDLEISEKLKEEFEKKYPNITVELIQFDVGSSSSELQGMATVGQLPDCFWILGSPDVFVKNALLYDMSLLWKYDSESKNVIKGINELKLGYCGTDAKWTTPVKFYPTTAFVNLDVFIRNDKEMPSMDWTWDEFEETVEKMTMTDKVHNKHVFGTSGWVSVITWYPLAADKECIGEFGWNGTQYDMEDWAYGMNLEAKWMQNENKPRELGYGGVEQLAQKYGEGVLYPEEHGYSAIHCDHWWNWEDYYVRDNYIEDNKIVFVPYMMPRVENVNDGTYLATMDMGAISATTNYPREAYELLKFMTWGVEGWKHKIKYYPDLIEQDSVGKGERVSKNNCPITLDKEVWEGFMKWYPNNETGDKYIIDMYGEEYDRSKYFDYFFNKVKESTWTCYGGQQIPGFDIWLQNVYYGNDGMQDFGYAGGLGIEQAVIYGGVDAKDYYEYLQEKGNSIHKEKLDELMSEITY